MYNWYSVRLFGLCFYFHRNTEKRKKKNVGIKFKNKVSVVKIKGSKKLGYSLE